MDYVLKVSKDEDYVLITVPHGTGENVCSRLFEIDGITKIGIIINHDTSEQTEDDELYVIYNTKTITDKQIQDLSHTFTV